MFLRELAKNLSDTGVEVTVLTPADGPGEERTEDGILVHRFSYFPLGWQRLAYRSGILPNLRKNPMLWMQVPFFVLAMTYHLIRLSRRIRPHVIHAHWILPQGLVAVFLRRVLNTPVVVTAHGGDAYALRGGVSRYLKRIVLQRSAAWTANTVATAVAAGPGCVPPKVIPMGVDVSRFSSGRGERLRSGVAADQLVLLFVGRLVEKKGVGDLIMALACMEDATERKYVLWIVGAGGQENRLREQSRHLGLETQVRFWGQIPNQELPDYYAAADVFVGPSVIDRSGDTEGMGVVFLEAFAAGVCVVATRVGGIENVVEDGKTGILVDPGAPRQLADVLTRLLADESHRRKLAEAGRKRAGERYHWPLVAARFSRLYSVVCGAHDG